MEQQEQEQEQEQAREPEAADRPAPSRAERRAALVARIRAANAETLERLAEL
ncbi:hypothetical protein [Kitasatospora sp. NPDC057198]|uniref:hypothetical protein n=1 Tax=Kitasatospora sp. NPDC057198 TaxID=3346046 RepID=UPI0036390DA8